MDWCGALGGVPGICGCAEAGASGIHLLVFTLVHTMAGL